MPVTNIGNTTGQSGQIDLSQDFGYSYPNKLDLRPSSRLHARLKNEIMDRARRSREVMQDRYRSWRKIDDSLTAYIPIDEKERAVKREDNRKPVAVVVPVSYAVRETLLTYMVEAFLQDPYFKYEQVGPDDTIGVAMLESVVAQQAIRAKMGLALHTQWGDSFTYGIGVLYVKWCQKWGRKTTTKPTMVPSELDGTPIQTGTQKVVEDRLIYEGNVLENIDPYLFLPDPNTPIHKIQDGEYVGWINQSNRMTLMREEAYSGGQIFNCKYLKSLQGVGRSSLVLDDYGRSQTADPNSTDRYRSSNWVRTGEGSPVDVCYMFIDLVPKEWKIGTSDQPEKWMFALAADQVIIAAQPLGLDHNMFPVAVAAPDYDGYSIAPVSRLEVVHGLQGVVDWLFSSHITNVRKAINDMLVVDPFLVNMADLEKSEGGKIIRMKRNGWGRGVEGAVKQLVVNDVTANHLSEVQVIMDIIHRVSGASDSLQGLMRQGGERRSATESRDTRASALSRLEKAVKIIGMQSMYDLGFMLASQTQQLMEESVWVRFTEQNKALLEKDYGRGPGFYVDPEQLDVGFDILPNNWTMRGAEYVDTWTQLLQIVSSQPEISAQFDVTRIFSHIAQLMGAKNIYDFVRKGGAVNATVLPDAQVAQMAQTGAIVPLNAQTGGGYGG